MHESTRSDKDTAHRPLLQRLRVQADDVRRLTSGLDDAQLATRTVPDKWSLHELVCHLWRVQQIFDTRVQAMLATENPAVAPYDPEGDRDFETMVARPGGSTVRDFLADRERFVAQLERLSPPDWHRPGRHPEYPRYDVHFQVEYMVHHEAHHLYQLFQRRAPLGKLPH